jgi:hypothetical protein
VATCTRGRKFHAFEGENIVRTFHKEGMKHGYSERMQLVPFQLMRLYDHVIDVFHTDPQTGQVDKSARLVPAMVAPDNGGQETFRLALKRAAEDAGVTTATFNGFARTALRLTNPKDLRSSAITDLEWIPGLDPTGLRRDAGQAPGTDVHALHYVADQPVNDKIVNVCKAMENLIDRELPTGLLVPTARRCTTGAQPLLAVRSEQIDARLIEHGWLVTGNDEPDDPWLSVEEVAEFLKRGLPPVRRWAREGRIEASLGKVTGGTHQGHRIRRSAALRFAVTEMQRTTLVDLEEDTGVSYHRLYNWIRRFSLEIEPVGERSIYIPPSTVTELERLIALERELRVAGISFADAACILGVQSRTIESRVLLGALEELPLRGPDGTRYVTRRTLQRVVQSPELMTIRRKKRKGRCR